MEGHICWIEVLINNWIKPRIEVNSKDFAISSYEVVLAAPEIHSTQAHREVARLL